jgi:hypothetical protein
MVTFGKLIEIATPRERLFMYLSWVGALVTGVGLPLFAQFI